LARKILLADDSVTAQNMGRKILADAGYEVITVNNGSAALKKIAEHKPDLIVLDVYMPGYSGLEVCQRLKEVKETARIPVLLTVGKLEPFKPEECKRVKAEGYIVKPFEASELLSALSKLEDRVVPRSESSKPGRFARAIAAVEEGRADEAAEANDADNGWKSRIAFPSKKKKKQREEEEHESETYNQVNRDLRTIVDRPGIDRPVIDRPGPNVDRPTPAQETSPKADDRLDVAALAAAAGLPKDVTPEELAALAAAAAQVQAAVDGRELAVPFIDPAEARSEAQIEAKSEAKSEDPRATSARQIAHSQDRVKQGSNQAKPASTVSDFEIVAAPANLDGANTGAEAASGNGTGYSQQETDKKETEKKHAVEEEAPATMAVAASAAFAAVSSTHRWTAVPVAVAGEEAAVSLEQEMQKAYAAFATAEANQPGFMSAAPAPENSIAVSAVPAGPVSNDDEISRTLRDAANVSPEAVDSALAKLEAAGAGRADIADAEVKELEAKREQEAKDRERREQEARDLEARAREAKEQEAREQEARAAEEARQREAREQEARAEEARQREIQEQEARAAEEARQREIREQEARAEEARQREIQEQEARAAEEARLREAREREAREEEARQQEAREKAAREQEEKERQEREREEQEREAKAREARELEAKQAEVAAAEAVIAEAVAEAARARTTESSELSEASVQRKGKGKKEKVSGGDMAEKENELAQTTAAAWASWRQIRETGDNKSTGSSKASRQDDDDEEYPEPASDQAAMAVAAGAEKSPSTEDSAEASPDPEDIANIVDKVLADLRPKIAEEISKKLKKK
jgi:CheY-like chemotaxis protein